jgi:hypothetical protein
LKTSNELRALLKNRTWDKEVLLWVGPEKVLSEVVSSSNPITLDLLDLFDLDKLPIDDEQTRNELRDRLRQRLKVIPKGPDNRTVLLVRSVGLLAPYKVGLKEFYDWFIGSYTLLILLLGEVAEHAKWPDEVRCQPKRLLDYFTEPGMVKEIYGAQG